MIRGDSSNTDVESFEPYSPMIKEVSHSPCPILSDDVIEPDQYESIQIVFDNNTELTLLDTPKGVIEIAIDPITTREYRHTYTGHQTVRDRYTIISSVVTEFESCEKLEKTCPPLYKAFEQYFKIIKSNR